MALLLLLLEVAANQGTAPGSSTKSVKKGSKQQQQLDEAEAGEKPEDLSWLQDMAAALCEKVSNNSNLKSVGQSGSWW